MLPFVGLGLAGVSLILNIVGLAIPYWIYTSNESTKFYFGLWQTCVSDAGVTVCNSFPAESLDGSFKAVRALEILGMMLIAGALVCAILKQFAMKEQKVLSVLGAGVAILAGILMIIGTIIFATMNNIQAKYLHAGFALCIVAGIFGIAAGVILLVSSLKKD